MANRAMRRQLEREQRKNLAKINKMSNDERRIALYRNGITGEDLQKNYDAGYNSGLEEGRTQQILTVYASIVSALRSQCHFGKDRICRVLNESFREIDRFTTDEEAVALIYNALNIKYDESDPFEPFNAVRNA